MNGSAHHEFQKKTRHGKLTDKSDKHNSKVMSEVLRDYGHFWQWEMNLHIFNVQVGKKIRN